MPEGNSPTANQQGTPIVNFFPTATKVSTSTSWQELVPFLRTGDVITVYNDQGAEHRVTVWVSDESQLITAGSRCIRHADGTFNSDVKDVLPLSASGRADELEQLAASLKAGDVVRATFLVPQGFFAESHTITLEGPVDVDREGDGFLALEDEDDDFVDFYDFTFSGRVSQHLRALEFIDP